MTDYCKDLASKRLYFTDGPPRTDADVVDGSNHCWCLRTMLALGPDGDVVGPEDCDAQRACFRPRTGPRPVEA